MNTRIRASAIAIAILGAALLALTGCGIGEDTVPPASTSRSCSDPLSNTAFGTANTCDQTQLITTALTVMFSWDPATDTNPHSASARALPLMTGELHTATEQGPQGPGSINPGADWLAQRDAGWATTAQVSVAREDGHVIYLVHQILTASPGKKPTPGPAGRSGRTVNDFSVTALTTRVSSGGFRLSQIQVR
ncbi:hypothetical protein [Williamsia sp.]|uniref:hypothetical protein n=1 Tax=Williamsia sp. TaxID=1872085 RepID=UPI001A233102|nr:hypothetical protein [Williamsia sp.]MBJ7287557.1 hypothetical protein [Williamsia sp.]